MAFNWLLSLSMTATPYFNERSFTILVVEDEALIRDFLHIVLTRMGHVVLEARDDLAQKALTHSGRCIIATPRATPRRLLEKLWRAKVDAAAVRYSENPCPETMAACRSVLRRFADLVLTGKSPEETNTTKPR